jgi:hypothetical protein
MAAPERQSPTPIPRGQWNGMSASFRRVILVKSALDVYTGPVPPNSLWHDERAVRDKF